MFKWNFSVCPCRPIYIMSGYNISMYVQVYIISVYILCETVSEVYPTGPSCGPNACEERGEVEIERTTPPVDEKISLCLQHSDRWGTHAHTHTHTRAHTAHISHTDRWETNTHIHHPPIPTYNTHVSHAH